MMTKKDMIEKIQEREASEWKNLREFENLLGEKNEHTKYYLHKWGTIYNLMEELGIETKRGEA